MIPIPKAARSVTTISEALCQGCWGPKEKQEVILTFELFGVCYRRKLVVHPSHLCE